MGLPGRPRVRATGNASSITLSIRTVLHCSSAPPLGSPDIGVGSLAKAALVLVEDQIRPSSRAMMSGRSVRQNLAMSIESQRAAERTLEEPCRGMLGQSRERGV